MAVIFELGQGLAIQLTEADDRICTKVLDGTGYEPESLKAWIENVRPGMAALDVGSYNGLYAIAAAKLGAKVWAIEPMPANQWRIGVNAKLNKVDVKLICAAASDHEGEALLFYNPRVALTTGASLQKDPHLHRDSIQVGCITLDMLALPPLAIIKVDVERHEPSVLRGAAHTIARHRPVLLVETLSDSLRSEVLRVLPSYVIAGVLDRRNTLFVPNGEHHAARSVRGDSLPQS